MTKKCTIDDIARLANVSSTTVSRVLNAKDDVDPQTRERILRIIDEQNFVPSITASGLPAGRSRLIGMLIPSCPGPVIPDVMPAIIQNVQQTPYDLSLYT